MAGRSGATLALYVFVCGVLVRAVSSCSWELLSGAERGGRQVTVCWGKAGRIGGFAVSAAYQVLWPDERAIDEVRQEECLRWDGKRELDASIPEMQAGMRLSHYVAKRYVPLRCVAEGRGDKTILGYFEALRHAVAVAGDLKVAELDDVWVARVRLGLEKAEYRRGRFGFRRVLGPATAEKHLRQIRAVIRSLGPDGEGVLTKPPRVRVGKVRRRPKGCYEVDELRALVRVAEESGERFSGFWRVCYGVLFYSGLRRTAALELEWDSLRVEGSRMWFDVDGQLNAKTGKPLWMPVHASLADALSQLRGTGRAQNKVIPWGMTPDYLLRTHKRWCALAGVERRADRPLDLHGVRRSLLTTAAFLSVETALRAAAVFGQHSDVGITSESYVSIAGLLARAVPALPSLW